MTERKGRNPSTQDKNHIFAERMWQLNPDDITSLNTIVYWVFGSIATPDQKYFFIKNSIFTSNYREKLDGKLNYGGMYQYLEEVDTTIPVEHERDGTLTSESWNKIFEYRNKLKQLYTEFL